MQEGRSITMQFRIPEFHNDPVKYPGETWAQHKQNLKLAYRVAGMVRENVPEDQRVAHLLQGLTGKARKILEYNPNLYDMRLNELETVLEQRFGKRSYTGIVDMNNVIQKDDETINEFVARLRSSAEGIMTRIKEVKVMTREEVENDPSIDPDTTMTPERYRLELSVYEEARDATILPFFLKGMKESIARGISHDRPRSLAAAVKAAEEYEIYQQMYGADRSARISMMEARDDLVEGVAKKLRDLNTSHPTGTNRNLAKPQHRREAGRPERRQGDYSCHNCKKLGHFARDCPDKNKDTSQKLDQGRPEKRYSRPVYPERIQERDVRKTTPPTAESAMRSQLQSRMPHLRRQDVGHVEPYPSQGRRGKPNDNMYAYQTKNGERPPRKRGGSPSPRGQKTRP